ncbi:possible ribosomal-protein-alanine acetyltransferase [Psychrobacter arcticus 273-4]|uniref:Possible ribosomal-protein-alanine acetyltransferase n=1 Tax=Psychrobacter arcticus (strain DSM 17307 / VKM B-2377 / 273-4) TaxID=259536 RepID=Q4FUQ5_PSYA2|nr:ribosomal protein S18-alanine N-acetyltransferase [Psychrobacter arcticus]AAZ18253.1 possible ribosomal-protein-alanine acetyltransferase [Psychrobacter arcticus 273-4]
MLAIKVLSTASVENHPIIQAVANIETVIQPQDAWGYQTIVELLAQDIIDLLAVYQSKKVVGYCLYQVVFEQAEILRIGTHPDYQRQGVASRIFARLEAELQAKQVESLLLEVRADNVPAIALYEQQAFAVIHKRKGYYHLLGQPAVDALIMQRVYN